MCILTLLFLYFLTDHGGVSVYLHREPLGLIVPSISSCSTSAVFNCCVLYMSFKCPIERWLCQQNFPLNTTATNLTHVIVVVTPHICTHIYTPRQPDPYWIIMMISPNLHSIIFPTPNSLLFLFSQTHTHTWFHKVKNEYEKEYFRYCRSAGSDVCKKHLFRSYFNLVTQMLLWLWYLY